MRCTLLLVLAAGLAPAQQVYRTVVEPASGDDLAAPCRYELTLPGGAPRALVAFFDYGPEVAALYNDPQIFRFASDQRLGLLLARHCASRSSGDVNTDPARGFGRMLFAAIDQFAAQAKLPELASAQLIPFGFSATAILAARFTAFSPERTLAAIVYAPGDGHRDALALLRLNADGAAVPQLIVANSNDEQNGTGAARDYFSAHFEQGAPWMFAIQNGAAQRGAAANLKPLLFGWIEPLLMPNAHTSIRRLIPPALRGGVWLFVRLDAHAGTVRDARVERSASKRRSGFVACGWAPSQQAANAWSAFVKARHPANGK